MTSQAALLLVNPNSRRGKDSLPEVRRLLQQAEIRFTELPADYTSTTSQAIEEHIGLVDRVIVGGGDGSLNGAVGGLLKAGLPLGVLPLGTANDFARTIGLPSDLAQAVDVIAKGNTTRIDLGEANGHPFFNVASVGFSADLAMSLTEKAKKHWGKLGYGIVAARLLASSRLFTATLEHDGQTEELRTLQVAVGNGRFYGGGMTVHSDATATDGMLDFYSLEVDHWWRLLALLPSLRKGTHGDWSDVRSFSTKHLTIRTSKPRAVNLDGELKTNTPVTFHIREKAISVFVP
ncbi:lipid kinase [Agrobacterium rosae]|uniref:Lipid kinase n=1 Tax=Agrobacterium rosae TaxID=1972867 RepID=A0AAE5RZP2_9HYPH|nr:lipid kinase [Agrobacterium rosae]KAA3509554.1 lipid kinase [Agrobacterium rosae]KAA3516454.1 lipid kinase [Agrobacterium rosae]MCM2434968.1 lipid kinase [Agrobacterium rosae]MDX8304874.1 lipid kinase [Agrobacterium rosae]MDX8330810.1 lipid kinase [Agrobacterium rosae]